MANTPYTLYLFREGLDLSKQRLRNPERYEPVALVEPPDADVNWELYIRQNPTSTVSWLDRLQTIMANPGGTLIVRQSAGAVLLIAGHGRVWAVTFGTGHHAIDPAEYEPDFGLRVAANSVDPRRVTLAETRGLDKGARNAVSVLPLPSEIFALRVATNEEWVRRFGGRLLDPDLGVSAAGADSLHLNLADFGLARLPAKLADLLAAFTADRYRQNFPFLDYFRRLTNRDPMIPLLEERLDALLRARSTDIGFASPDDLQRFHPDGYELHFRRATVAIVELTAEHVYDALDALDAREQARKQVRVVPRGGDVPDDEQFVLGHYLVANVCADDAGTEREFALTAGSWFKVDQSYAERIERFMETVEDITDQLDLPDWDDEWLTANVDGKYAEQRYNRHVSGERGYRLLDREMYIGPAHTGQRVEVCDLLTSRKELICVKRLDGAESLIHLFEQGALSAGMMRDEAYRQRLVGDLRTCGGGDQFGENSDWTFIFAIATSRPRPLRDLFTFFAKVALNNNADAIQGRGFRMKIAKIDRPG